MAKTAYQIKKALGLSNGLRAKGKPETAEEIKANIKAGKYKSSFNLVKSDLEKAIRFDTLQSDLSSMSKTLADINTNWQTQETMNNTRSSIDSMQKRLRSLKEYQMLFGNKDTKDIDNLQGGIRASLNNWDNLSNLYGNYKNADAFNIAKKNAQFSEQFKGLSYEEVQAEKKKYKTDSDEYKFLDTYTEYGDLNDFNKAINAFEDISTGAKPYRDALDNITKQAINIRSQHDAQALQESYNKTKNEYNKYLKDMGYESEAAFEKALDENKAYFERLETARNKHKLDHTFDNYKHYSENADFEKNSKYVSTEGKFDGSWDKINKGPYGMGYGDLTYEYVNNVGGIRDKIEAKHTMYSKDTMQLFDTGNSSMKDKGYDKLNPDEIAVYNYLYKTEGVDKAQAFLDEMEMTLTKRTYDEKTKRWENSVDNPLGAFVHSALSIPASVFGSIPTLIDTAKDAIQGKSYNPYSANKTLSNYALDTREYVGENIAEATEGMKWFGQNIPSFLYSTGMSIGDNLLGATTLGSAYLPLMGTNAFHQKAKEMTEAGEDTATIYKTALASAAAEIVFEKFSLDHFLKMKNVDGVGKIVTNALKQAGIEGSEEIGTELANIISDKIIRGDNSEFSQQYQELLKRGFTEKEASVEIGTKIFSQVAWAGIGGALSGMTLGLTGSGVSYIQNKSIGKDIKNNERVNDLFDIASNPEVASAYDTYTRYANKGINAENISDAKLGNLYSSAKADAVETLSSKKTTAEQKQNASKTLARLSVVDTENTVAKRAKELNVGEETKVTESGVAVDVQGLKVKGDEVTFTSDEGDVSVDDMTLTQRDAELVVLAKGISQTNGEDIANVFLSQYDGKTNAYEYANSFNLAVNYAKNSFPEETILENKGPLSTSQVKAIYQATVINEANARETELENLANEQGKNMTIQGIFDDSIIDYTNSTTDGSKVNWRSLTSAQRAAIKFTKLFSKATGVNIKFIKSNVKDGKHKGKNGSYDPDKNTIEIDVYAGRIDAASIKDSIIPTLSHELTHWMKAKSPAIFNSIKEDVIKTLKESTGLSSDVLIAKELNRLNENHPDKEHTVDEAVEELVARTCEDMLSNSKSARELLSKMSESEQQSFINKVKETFEKLMQWVNDLLAHYKSTSEEAKILNDYKHMLKKISKQWDEMLIKSVKVNQALEKSDAYGHENNAEGVKFSEREIIGISGKSYGIGVYLDSNLLTGLTADERKAMVKEYVVTELAGKHFIAYDTNNNAVDIGIAKKNDTIKNSNNNKANVLKELHHKSNDIVVKQEAIVLIDELIANAKYDKSKSPNKQHGWLDNYGKNDWDYWKVFIQEKNKSVWEATLNIANTANGEKILYDIKPIKKVEEGIKSPSTTTNYIIRNSGRNVNTKFSDMDSTGRELSKGQKDYFKDSVVRDENGSLKVMYRGDSNNFTVFDKKKTKHSNLYGRGFYFTDSKAHAEQYGGSREFYLDINNPLSPKQNAITKKQMVNFLKAIENDGEDYDLYNYGQEATAESVLSSVWGKGDFEMLQDINAGAIGDLVAAVELFNKVNGTNYDGIILPTETVTFNSEQAKLTSNLNPTEDKDMRFSMRENVEETRDLIAVHNMQVSELERTLDLGGLPMPSIAIIKAKSGHSEYGDVSLVFAKSTIDPKANRNNKVYGGDAWTPTYPKIEYKPNAKVTKKINDKYYEFSRKFGYDESRPLYNYVYDMEDILNRHNGEAEMIADLYEDQNMMQLYLLDSGKDKVETIQKETRTELTDAEVQMNEFFIKELGADVVDEIVWDGNGTPMSYRKTYLSKYENAIREAYKKLLSEEYHFTDEQVQNVMDSTKNADLIMFMRDAHKYRENGRITTKTEADYEATKEAIKTAAGEGYRKWVDSLFKGIEEKSGIRNNTDYFTDSGNRRSWEALHWENNLENVVMVMQSQDNGVAALFSGHAIWAVSAKDYRSIDEIKADTDRLKQLSEEEYNKIKEGFGERLQEIAHSIMDKRESNPFIASDNAMSCIVEAVRNSKTKSGMLKNLKEYKQLTITETTVDDIVSLVTDISNMPTEYFEAKPKRAVKLNEIATAIIPDNTSEATKARLDDMGIKYVEYESGSEDARLKALNSLEEVRFSDRDYSYNELVAKPDMKLTVLDSNVPSNRADIIHQAKKNAAKVGNVNDKNKTVSVFVGDIDRDVVIGTKGLQHGLRRLKTLQTDANSFATLKAGEIIKNSIRINEFTPENKNADSSYVLIGAAKSISGDLYIVQSVINQFSNELMLMDVLYSINTKKENRLRSMRPEILPSVTDSTISIAELLDYVNKYFPDILPESVLRHYGYDARPDGDLGESALYSDRDDTSVYDLMGETERIRKENEKFRAEIERLKERLKLERKVTHGNYFNENQLGAVAGHLRKISNSNIDKVELMKSLKDVYSFIANSENLTWEEVFEKSYRVADAMLAEAKPEIMVDDYSKQILREIRGKRISLTESQKKEAQHIFGKNWNRNFFGRVTITDSGMSLESQWQEWSEQYPNLFDADISDVDMPGELYDIIGSLQDASETVMEYNREDMSRWLANEVYNQYWNISPIRTTADKYDKQIKRLNYEHRNAMKELRDDYNSRLNEQHKTDIENHKNLVKELRERKDKQIAQAKEHGKEMLSKYKDNAERKTSIQRITANALSLNEMLVKNSKDKHIPEIMREPVTALLQAIDFSSKRLLNKGIPTQKDISLSKALRKVKDMMDKATNSTNTHNELVELYGHGLDNDIENMVKSVDNIMSSVGDNEFILNKMSLTDLKTLDKTVKTIRHAVNKLNKFHTVNHSRGVANLSQESVLYLDSLGKGKIHDGKRGVIEKHLNWNNALPYYVFKRYGSGGMKVFEALQDGWDKFAFNTKEIIDYANAIYTSEEVKEWSEEVKTFKIPIPAKEFELSSDNYTPQYQEVQLTVPQIMSMYCLNKREQARGHLFKGGIRVADFKGKNGNIVSQSEGVIFTEKNVQSIFNSLTTRQKNVADKLQEFMNTVCMEWGNEVSMARFGYKAFGEKDYFPIQSDKNNLAVNDETERPNSLFRILNFSFSKQTDPDANNRIVISDIFDVFAQHTSDMAKYHAFALPVLDAFKWYNYTEKEDIAEGTFKTIGVKQSIEKAFGKDGQNYFTTFLKDINGQQEADREQLSKAFMRNYKIASVGANLRVILLQPTSYVRASAVIDDKYLTKALGHKPKIKKAETYCGIALWKSMGYFDTNIQRGVAEQIKHADTWKDKAIDWTMKGAEVADKVTWGYLWNACELEIRDKRKDLKVGSKDFYDAIGKRLREVIYATQVVDSTMTRSQIMRSTKMHDQIMTNFASEPTLAYNMLQDAYMEYSLDARRIGKKNAIKKNGKRIARILKAYTMTNALAALIESVFDALRDDDEEEMDIVAFMKLYLGNFASDMSITGKIPYIKEIHSLIKGYSVSRSELAWAESSYKAITGFYKNLQGKGNPGSTINNSLKTISYLSSLPFYNLYRDALATLDKLDIFTIEDLNDMFKEFVLYGIIEEGK